MSSFTKSQSEAIRHVDGPLLVLAGPGSGKTTVVTKRVQYLVQDCSISPSSILVITFTKAAATEMKERFTRLMEQQAQPPGGYGNVSFGTFHAVFFNILKLSYGFTVANIITEETRRQYLKESVDQSDQKSTARTRTRDFKKLFGRGVPKDLRGLRRTKEACKTH